MTGRHERTARASMALAVARGCILCGARADAAGMFMPDDPQAWGAPLGKTRTIFYGLCGSCVDVGDLDAIERRLAPRRRAV